MTKYVGIVTDNLYIKESIQGGYLVSIELQESLLKKIEGYSYYRVYQDELDYFNNKEH